VIYATVDFDDGLPYIGNRPVGDVVLHGPAGAGRPPWSVQALVDTGADYLHLPLQALQAVGISTSGASRFRILTAGGTIVVQQTTVDVEIQGVRVNVPCNFASGMKPLIGRQAIFQVLDTAGFSATEWLLDWYPAGGASSTATAGSATASPSGT
jgi:predicted aspartyl protease